MEEFGVGIAVLRVGGVGRGSEKGGRGESEGSKGNSRGDEGEVGGERVGDYRGDGGEVGIPEDWVRGRWV